MRTRNRWTAISIVALVAAVTSGLAVTRWDYTRPSTDTDPRVHTPNDPEYDWAEPDDEDGDFFAGRSVFEEDHRLFGFAPESTSDSAKYLDPGHPPPDPGNRRSLGAPQISGVSADIAWKLSIGDQSVEVAICDTGIRWDRKELRRRIRLNTGELPVPCGATAGQKGRPLAEYDCDGDGIFTPDDYAGMVAPNEGPQVDATLLDGQDVLVHFSDGVDDDGNGFVDDIAGWDFFDDDNDPFDASSYSSAGNHGSGRAEDALAEANNGFRPPDEDPQGASLGLCPLCRLVPIRIWDTFVADNNNFALCLLYAADNGIEVTEAAIGAHTTTAFAQAATQYAYEHGVAEMDVSSDLDTADHNTPTNFNNTIFVKGVVADVEGLGQSPPDNPFPHPPFFAFDLPVGTWFRDSNLTQYGGHAHIDMKGSTGSECTGQAAGAAGLLMSYAKQRLTPLTSNEVKQILTLTAEDVLPGDTGGTGVPDPSQVGWDQHFGYGRVNLRAALERVDAEATIPPEATIERPAWFQVLDPDMDNDGVNESLMVPIVGTASADRGGTTSFDYTLEFGVGIEPTIFTPFASGSRPSRVGFDGTSSPPRRPGAVLGTLDLTQVMTALGCSASNCSLPPSGTVVQGQADVPSNQFAFTVRLRVTDDDDATNSGEDRKVFFVHHDRTKHLGWPIAIDTDGDGRTDGGGEPPPQIVDLDGDNRMEIVQATAAGRIYAFEEDGSQLPGFPLLTNMARNVATHLGAPAFASGAVAPPSPSTSSRPAIGDLDRDGFPEIVYANVEGDVYVFRHDGTPFPNFPVRIDPALSAVPLRTKQNHVKTGIFASPVLGDLDRDGFLDIVLAALDQHAYAWDRNGNLLPGWPVKLQDTRGDCIKICAGGPNDGDQCNTAADCEDPTKPPTIPPPTCIPSGRVVGAESINTAVLADLDVPADGTLEVVVETNEVCSATADATQFFPADQNTPTSIPGLTTGTVLAAAFAGAGGSGRIYAVHHDGTLHAGGPFVTGWPAKLDGLSIDLLPLVGPGHNVAVGDLDPVSPGLEVAAGISTSNLVLFRGNGTRIRDMDPSAHGAASDTTQDNGSILNLFEYPSIGDIDRDGRLDLTKAGLTVQGAVNLLLVGQNQPFHHVLQAWTAATGQPLPAFPKVIDDYALVTLPLIANVGATVEDPGDTLNLPEIVSGNGLYMVHAFDFAGREPDGWPKLTGGWHIGAPGAGDIDDDGKLEIAWPTREGNFFVWDTPAPMCNTATTNLPDGRDGAYNPLVNTHNNNRYGEDTVPPARFAPGEIVSTSHDRSASTITVTFARIPGDDMYCGTAARFDFRFSTAGPITTQAAFDAADAVASVPAPPHGNHDAGGSLTVGDARFANQLVHLAVQVVDDAGNVSPITSIGSFDFLRTFTLQKAVLSFGASGPGGGDDRLKLRAIVPMPLASFDPGSEAFSLALADQDGTFFSATLPINPFAANPSRTRLVFRGPGPGLTRVTLTQDRRSGGMRVRVRGGGLSLTGADRLEITTTLGFGADVFASTNLFRSARTRLRYP